MTYLIAQAERDILKGPSPPTTLARDLQQIRRLITRAEQGNRTPFASETGIVRRAYRSPLDASLQPYVMLVPPSYKRRRDRAFPLIVASHGLHYTPEDMLAIAVGKPTRPGASLAANYRRSLDFDDFGALVVAHDGYGNAGHRPPGEHDVLQVIDAVKRSYRVAPNRVSLTGFSLGGSVGFWLPFHYPDRFSAAAPLCGYPNVLQYRTIRNLRRAPWETELLAQEAIVNYAENGRYIPLRIVHGERDNPARSTVVVERYHELNYKAEIDVPEGMGHNVWDYAYEDGELLRWLAKKRRPQVPSAPRLKTGALPLRKELLA